MNQILVTFFSKKLDTFKHIKYFQTYEIFLGNACKIFSSPDGGEEQDVEDDEGGAGRQVDHHHAEPDTSTCHDIFSWKYISTFSTSRVECQQAFPVCINFEDHILTQHEYSVFLEAVCPLENYLDATKLSAG